LFLGNVVGSLLAYIVCRFIGEIVGDEKVCLDVGCAVGDKMVAKKMIGNIAGIRVRVSIVGVVGNCAGKIVELLEDDDLGFQVGIFEGFVVGEIVRGYEVLLNLLE
jgi:hypothetical protein